MDSEIKVRVRADGASVKKALAGITRDITAAEKDRAKQAQKAERDVTAASKKSAAERTKAHQRHVSSFKRAEQSKRADAIARSREILEDFRRAERRKREELKKTLRETQMSERQRAALISRTERQIARDRRAAAGAAGDARSGGARAAARSRRRQAMGVMGGALAGGAMGALNVAQRAQGALGIRSQEELVAAAIEQRQNFIRTARQGGMDTREQDRVLGEVTRVSRASGIGAGDILEGINISQELFANLDRLVPNLEFMAQVARATGGEFSTIVAAGGELERQFGLSGDELQEAIALISQGAEIGSLSLRDFAESQAQGFAGFRTARGIGGLQAVREFQAVAQGLRAGGLNADEVRTRQAAFTSSLSDQQVQRRLRRAGVNVLGEDGNLRNFGEIINEISGNRNLRSSTQLRRAFGSQEAAQVVSILGGQERAAASGQEGALSIAQREAVDAAAGRQGIAETNARLNADASGRAVQLRANREASVLDNSESLIDAFAGVAEPLTNLQDEMPLLTQAVSALTTVLGGAGVGGAGGGILSSLMGGAAGGAGAAAAGGGAAGVGTLAAAGGAAAVGTAVAIPAALAAGGMAVESSEGDTMFDFWRNVFATGSLTQAASGNQGQAAKSGVSEESARAAQENTRALQDSARAQRELANALRARPVDTGAEVD